VAAQSAPTAAAVDTTLSSTVTVEIRTDEDVVRVRQSVRAAAVAIGMRLVEQTKLVTAASELSRNALDYGGGGKAELQVLRHGPRCGVRLIVEDDGPGIVDVGLALTDGYSTGGGMGLGLAGARRLVDEFELWSEVGVGSCVTIVGWAS
jgi:serine/threonine-protein kinase RsbT